MLKLIVEIDKKRMGDYVLEQGENIIGRSRKSTVRVDAPDISRAHLKITVSDGGAVAENMSKFGSKLNGVPIEEPAELAHGARLTVGDMTTLIFQDSEIAGESAPDADEEVRTMIETDERAEDPSAELSDMTSAGDAGPSGIPVPEPVDSTADELPSADDFPATGNEDEPFGTSAAVHGGPGDTMSSMSGTGGGATQAMQTRLVSPEELEILKLTEQKRVRKRMAVMAMVIVPTVILAVVFRPRALPPENVIEWPMDEKGYVDAFEPAPSGSFVDGGFDIFYPGTEGAKVLPAPGGLVIECMIGRDRNVPMRIVLKEETDKRFLEMSRDAAVNDWIESAAASGGKWNFDKPSPILGFFGGEKGVPYIRVSYRREEKDSWYGAVSIFRYGSRRVSVRAEVPAQEKVRAADMVGKGFVRASISYQRTHWEPTQELPKAAGSAILADVRRDLARMAPATWGETETRLVGVLTKASINDDAEAVEEGTRLLMELRTRQAKWFNSQQFARDNAVAEGNYSRAERVAAYTKAVFSNLEDRRYYTVRKWKLEPTEP